MDNVRLHFHPIVNRDSKNVPDRMDATEVYQVGRMNINFKFLRSLAH